MNGANLMELAFVAELYGLANSSDKLRCGHKRTDQHHGIDNQNASTGSEKIIFR